MPHTIKVKAKYIGRDDGSFKPDEIYTVTLFIYAGITELSLFDTNKNRVEYKNITMFLYDWSYVTLQKKENEIL